MYNHKEVEKKIRENYEAAFEKSLGDEEIDEKEAKFCISIVKNIVDYIDSI